MEEKKEIFGIFVSNTMPNSYSRPELSEADVCIARLKAEDDGKSVRDFLWGDKSIDIEFKKTDYHNYGEDMKLILFQFYLNPIGYDMRHIEGIESYRKKKQ